MKKFFMMALVAGAAFMMACGGVASKAESFANDIAEATKAGDAEKVASLTKEMEEYVNGLSEEEKAEFDAVFAKATAGNAMEMAGELE